MARSTAQALLLVDGYNMIGAWSHLKQASEQDGLEAARRDLIESLINYSAFQGFDTQIIFDAQYQGTPGTKDVITPHLLVFYTSFLQTADSYIEQACAKFRHDIRRFHQRLIVATSDRAQQLTVTGYGAECLSALQLQADVEMAACRVRSKQKQQGRSPGRFLASSLDPAAQQRLAKLRLGLNSKQ